MSLSFHRFIVAALLCTSCAPSDGAGKLPNVILITLDTLRADHLSCYGYDKPTSPRIDAFAGQATRYERSFATAPWTAPTHASLFTGKHPFEHGARSFDVELRALNVHPLPEDEITLAEVLSQQGYATAGIAANNVYLGGQFRLNQGFATWDVERAYADGVNARAFEWLAGQGDRPFFLFLNYMDTHRPYNVTPRDGEPEFTTGSAELLDRMFTHVMCDGGEPGELEGELIPQYDRAIRNLDAELGHLFDELVARDLFDDTLIILTSDHGEYFGEHGLVEHSKDVYDEALRVPMIVKHPGQASGEVVDVPVSSVDVPRIVLEALPEELRERLRKRFEYAPGSHPIVAENYYSRCKEILHPVIGDRFRRVRTAFYSGEYKYIHSSDGAHELYELTGDPDESRNVIAEQPSIAARLARELEDFQHGKVRTMRPHALEQLSPEQLQEMRALGYAGDDEEEEAAQDEADK